MVQSPLFEMSYLKLSSEGIDSILYDAPTSSAAPCFIDGSFSMVADSRRKYKPKHADAMTTPRQRDALYTCRPKHNAEFLRCPGSVSDAPSTYSLFQQTDSTTSYPQKSLCAFSTRWYTHRHTPATSRPAPHRISSHFDFTKSASHQRLACLLQTATNNASVWLKGASMK